MHERRHVALMAQLGEHCNGNVEVVGSNPIKSLKILSVHFHSSPVATFAPIISTVSAYIEQKIQHSLTDTLKTT